MSKTKELKELKRGRFIRIGNSGRYYKVIARTKNGLSLTNSFYLGSSPTGNWPFNFSSIKDNYNYWVIVPENSREAMYLKASAKC